MSIHLLGGGLEVAGDGSVWTVEREGEAERVSVAILSA